MAMHVIYAANSLVSCSPRSVDPFTAVDCHILPRLIGVVPDYQAFRQELFVKWKSPVKSKRSELPVLRWQSTSVAIAISKAQSLQTLHFACPEVLRGAIDCLIIRQAGPPATLLVMTRAQGGPLLLPVIWCHK